MSNRMTQVSIKFFWFLISLVFSSFATNEDTTLEGFLAGTQVLTPTGIKQIEHIQEDESVIVYNFKRKRFSSRHVFKPIVCHVERYLILLISGEFIGTSFDHQFYLSTRNEWVAARDLKVNDVLLTNTNKPAVIEAILAIDQHTTLHSLIVKRKHNFLVGSQGIVAHNFIVVPFIVTWGAGLGAHIMWSTMLETCLSSAALYLAFSCMPDTKPCKTCTDFVRQNWAPSVPTYLREPFLSQPLKIDPPAQAPYVLMPTIDHTIQTSLCKLNNALERDAAWHAHTKTNGINLYEIWSNFIHTYQPEHLYPTNRYIPKIYTGTPYSDIASAHQPTNNLLCVAHQLVSSAQSNTPINLNKESKKEQISQDKKPDNNHNGPGPKLAGPAGLAAAEKQRREAKKLENKTFWEQAKPKMEETAQKINNGQIKNTLKPLGKGSTGRTEPRNLKEKLLLEEISQNPYAGNPIDTMDPLHDPRWKDWKKMETHRIFSDGTKSEIHYVGEFKEHILTSIDDFKFKK